MKFNKIAACLLATACTASMFGAMTVSAADSLTIKAGTASAKAGETFTIDISLAGVPSSGIAGLDFAVTYDSSVFEVVSVTEGAVSKTTDKYVEGASSNLATNITAGEVSVLWATGQISTNSSWIKSDGVLLTLNCKALKDGKSDVKIVKGSRADATSVDAVVEGLQIVNPAVSAGSVSVGDNTPVTTDTTLGDVNKDGKVDLDDLTALSLYLLGEKKLDDEALENADVVDDGSVDLADLATIKQFVMKVISNF